MKSLLTNPWFQLAGLLAVVSGGISAYNEAATGAYSGTPRLPDTTAIQPSATPPTGPGDPSGGDTAGPTAVRIMRPIVDGNLPPAPLVGEDRTLPDVPPLDVK